MASFLFAVLALASCGSDIPTADDAPATSADDDAQDPADVAGDTTTSARVSEPTTASDPITDVAQACSRESLDAASSSEPSPPPGDVVVLADTDGLQLCLGPALIDNKIIESATVDISEWGEWTLFPVFTLDGIEQFNAAAASCSTTRPDLEVCPLSRLAIVDGYSVVSSPTINADSFERDQVIITANFTEMEARDLATSLVADGIRAPTRHGRS